MINTLIHYFGIIGKFTVFLFILLVIVNAIIKHGKPKVIEHNLFRTLIFNLILIILYAIGGMLNTLTIGLFIVALFHLGDIIESIRKNNFVEFTVYDAYKSVPVMIFYFISLYLSNYWSPILRF